MLVPVGEPPSQSLKSVGAGRDICEVGILRKYHFSKKWHFFENLLKKFAGPSFEAHGADVPLNAGDDFPTEWKLWFF